MFPQQEENIAIMEETYSTLSVPGCYKQVQLAVKELMGFSHGELLLLEAGS
jgi:hypothetical protein